MGCPISRSISLRFNCLFSGRGLVAWPRAEHVKCCSNAGSDRGDLPRARRMAFSRQLAALVGGVFVGGVGSVVLAQSFDQRAICGSAFFLSPAAVGGGRVRALVGIRVFSRTSSAPGYPHHSAHGL